MITIDFNQIARIAKLVALLGFFLPWVTVSCSSTEMLHATGWQLMTGQPELSGPFASMQGEAQRQEHEPALFVVAAFVAVLAGLALSLTTRAQAAALNLLVCATLGLGLSYYSIQNMRSEMRREISEQQAEHGGAAADNPLFSAQQQEELSRSVADQIRIEEQEGYWLTLGALLVAALFALLTLTSKRAAAATGPPPEGG